VLQPRTLATLPESEAYDLLSYAVARGIGLALGKKR
jgi:hypothetical protein